MKLNKSALLLTAILLGTGLLSSCNESQNTAIRASSALGNAHESFSKIIGGFKDSSEELSGTLDKGKESLLSFRSAVNEARGQNPDFDSVYREWGDVGEKTAALKKKFMDLTAGADAFFMAAEQHASTITDAEIRGDAIAAINESRDKYLKHLKETKSRIEPLDRMKAQVDDTMKALEIRFAIDVADERIEKILAEVDTMIKEAVESLKQLREESELVLKSSYGRS